MRLPDAKTWVRIALMLIAISFVTYMIFIPTVDAIASAIREKPKRTFQSPTELTFAEQVRLRTIEGFTAFWFFALGASIGSFLNVVVYRMPLGKSLVMTGSRCPTHQSLFKENGASLNKAEDYSRFAFEAPG